MSSKSKENKASKPQLVSATKGKPCHRLMNGFGFQQNAIWSLLESEAPRQKGRTPLVYCFLIYTCAMKHETFWSLQQVSLSWKWKKYDQNSRFLISINSAKKTISSLKKWIVQVSFCTHSPKTTGSSCRDLQQFSKRFYHVTVVLLQMQ